MYNYVCLVGNLTRDPDLRYLPTGTPVVEFGLAVNRKFKQNGELKEEVYFANITYFGKGAESCAKYLSKGSQALVEGRITENRWEKDGQKHSKTVIQASSVKFLGGKGQKASTDSSLPPEEVTDLEPF